MKIRVMYFSLTGNTKKLAKAIAAALNVEAEPITKKQAPLSEPVDLLFIGGAINCGRPNKRVADFIARLNPDMVKNTAVFATFGGMSKIGADLQKLLQDRGLKTAGEPFITKGQSWLVFNRHRPNETDLSKAAKFAQKIVGEIDKRPVG